MNNLNYKQFACVYEKINSLWRSFRLCKGHFYHVKTLIKIVPKFINLMKLQLIRKGQLTLRLAKCRLIIHSYTQELIQPDRSMNNSSTI